ncbi:hypothetical protein ACEWY4_025100 [Coilia grayii]|uniref:C1q domain-containing protein n=1 Tax=Coilia grayii TaxID=363190 RepID=A0ABD1IZP6_9TELE
MKTCGALLVLLCCCWAEAQLRGETISENDITHQGHYGESETPHDEVMGAAQRTEAAATASTHQTCQPDIHTVLRDMSVLIAEQKVELRHTRTQMEAMETRLRASESKAEGMETRLRASEKMVQEQRAVMKELKEKQEEQAAAVGAVGGSLNLTESQVEELRREREERRVSFSASLLASGSGYAGPFAVSTNLVFRHIITNSGSHYNPNTGVFTAPVRGVYYFVMFLHGHGHQSIPTAASLYKNGEHVATAYSFHPGTALSASNGASLLLEVGDVVYVQLWPGGRLFDDQYNPTTFSGYLLFPM